MIEIKNLTKRFGDKTVVDNLSFTVMPGEILGFLGPNGAGKSTTMKMVTGFLLPTDGTVHVCGHDIVDDTLAAQRCLGYLPEGAPGYGDMTVKGFLSFIADIRGLSGLPKKQAIDRVVEQIELQSVFSQTLETLSKGFRRRVGVAQAMLHDPQILIMDEPTDGLDPNQKHHVRNLIEQLSREKIVIVSTHILEEVTAVCTRAIIINQGRLVADDTPENLEAQSMRHQAVTISLSEYDAHMIAMLRAIPHVLDVEVDERARKVTVFPEEGAAIFHEVMTLIQKMNVSVDNIYVERGHLDEVFRRLTAGVQS